MPINGRWVIHSSESFQNSFAFLKIEKMEFLAEKGSIETMKKYTDKHRDNIPGKDYPQNSDHAKLSCFEKWPTKNLGYLYKIRLV